MTIDDTTRTSESAAIDALFDLARGNLFGENVPPALLQYADADYDTSLKLQLGVLDRWLAAGEELGGWKIGLTSRAARDSMGVGVRPHGYILASRILDSGRMITADIPNCRLEPEIAVTLGADLAGDDVTVEQARAAVASVSAAFEVNSLRVVRGSSLAVRLGNSLNNWGLVMGPAVPPEDVDLAALQVQIGNEAGVVDSGASTPDVIDDPYLSLTRICRSLAVNGQGLRAGQRLLTGSLTPPVATAGHSSFSADFGALGSVSITFG